MPSWYFPSPPTFGAAGSSSLFAAALVIIERCLSERVKIRTVFVVPWNPIRDGNVDAKQTRRPPFLMRRCPKESSIMRLGMGSNTWVLIGACVLLWNAGIMLISWRPSSTSSPLISSPDSDVSISTKLDTLNHNILVLQNALGIDPNTPHTTTKTNPANEKQTIVLPLGPKDGARFQNLYKSMRKFFDFSSVSEWIIITPDKTAGYVQEVMNVLDDTTRELVTLLDDTEVIPVMKKKPTSNWMTQQIIKLGVASLIKTRFYLILDSDLLCIKPTSFTDLVVNGKAMVNMYNSDSEVTLPDWWKSSETTLQLKMNSPTYFGVTPAMLATEVVLGLHKHIETIHNQEWSEYLLDNVYNFSFTEFCLYGVYVMATKQFQTFHIPTQNGVYNSDKSVWFESQFKALDLGQIVRQAHALPGHFLVMQSNTGIPASEVAIKMESLFD